MAEAAPDTPARREALDPERSFIVQAPAGSGKTELLVQRVLTLLVRVDHPEEVVAITFTRKAAGEMRERILRELAAAQGPAPEAPHKRATWKLAAAVLTRDRERDWHLAENPARLRVYTIDAFCQHLVRRMPFLSRIGGEAQVADPPGEFHRRAAVSVFDHLGDGGPRGDALRTLLVHQNNEMDRCVSQLEGMLARRDQWMRHLPVREDDADAFIGELERALERAVVDTLAAAAAAASPIAEPLVEVARYAADQLPEDSPLGSLRTRRGLPEAGPRALSAWRGLADLLLTATGDLRRRVNKDQGFPPAGAFSGEEDRGRAERMKAQMQELLDGIDPEGPLVRQLRRVRDLPEPVFPDAQREVLRALCVVLHLAVAELKWVFSQSGMVDYAEIAEGAIAALGPEERPTDLGMALDYRVRHILVDEFQDTSHRQFRLLERLTAGWQPGDGHTLFLVGDPMQSIYGFREAEVGLYLRARHHGLGTVSLTPLTLTANFRSSAEVVAWVNDAFARVMPADEDIGRGAVTYTPCEAANRDVGRGSVQVHPWLRHGEDAASEAEAVVDLVQAERAQNSEGSIAVLVRARAHLDAILAAFAEADIPCRAVEIGSLADKPVVSDLHALTLALLNPADRVVWLALLRAPWCGLTLRDLLALAGEGDGRPVPELLAAVGRLERLTEDGRARVARLRTAMVPALRSRGTEPLSQRVEAAWVALGGPACIPEGDLAHVDRYLALLDNLGQGGVPLSARLLARRLADLKADPTGEGVVEVMTVHKAKGLEWDTVIVPGLGRGTRRRERDLLAWMERPLGETDTACDLLLAPLGERGEEHDPGYRFINRSLDGKEVYEAQRLLYVAATRARRNLHLLGYARANKQAIRPASGSLLERLWPAVEEHYLSLEVPGTKPGTEPERPVAPIRRLPADFRPPEPAPAVGAEAEGVPFEQGGEDLEFSWAGEVARAVGTIAHRAFQWIARDGVAKWDAERVRAARPRFAAALGALGMSEGDVRAAVDQVEAALCRTLEDPRGRWLLEPHDTARSEYTVSGVIGGRVVQRVIDRTFVEDGVRWIVDFKTGTHGGGDLAFFLSEERRRYQGQLETYARLMSGMDGRPIRLGLYYPLLSEFLDWGWEKGVEVSASPGI